MRLFFAVNFSDGIKGGIQQAIDDLAIVNPPWRWVAVANLHLTMKFLGEMSEEHLATLGECGADVCGGIDPFEITLGRLGAFPALKRPRVLFYQIEDGAASLESLAARLDERLFEALGIPRETRPFRAHATIARVKKELSREISDRLRAAPPLAGASQKVEKLSLMKSQLRPQGAIYHPLKEFALSKSKC